jgi:hypothetical protein
MELDHMTVIKHIFGFIALLGVCTITAKAQCSDPNIGSKPISVSASGSTIIIPAVAGRSVHLCVVSVAFASAVNVTLQSTTSGGAQTALSGAYRVNLGAPGAWPRQARVAPENLA